MRLTRRQIRCREPPPARTAPRRVTRGGGGGRYLGVNFVISHNFEGVRSVLEDADRAKHVKRDWAYEQVTYHDHAG